MESWSPGQLFHGKSLDNWSASGKMDLDGPVNKTKLTQMESSLISQMDEAKNDFIISLTSTFSEQPKKLYNYINSLSCNKPNMKSIIYCLCFQRIFQFYFYY